LIGCPGELVGGEGDSQIPDREVGCLTREEVGGQIFLLLITFDGHHLSFGNVASQAGCPTEGIEDGPDDEEVLLLRTYENHQVIYLE
jgi:hypothetical protein